MTSPSTTNCVVCGEIATCFGGHVHKGDETMIAGFCEAHFKNKGNIKNKRNCKGCYGEWKIDMGINQTFIQTGYIDKDGIKFDEP